MQVLITGGTGFIGSRLAAACREGGDQVRLLGQANTDAERQNLEQLKSQGYQIVLGSVTNADEVRRAVAGCDVVYHLAAAQHEAGKPDEHFRHVNVDGTRTMLQQSLEAGVKRFVHGSTIGVYDAEHGTVSDDTAAVPDNIYGVTKLEAEGLVRSYMDKLSCAMIRISETYGPGDRRLLKLYKGIKKGKYFHIGRGDNLHHPVYIDDLVSALRKAAVVDNPPREPMVVPGYEVVTSRQMADTIADSMGYKRPKLTVPLGPLWLMAVLMETTMRPLGMNPPLHRRRMHFFTKSFHFKGDLARKALGYEATVSFADGAKRTGAWYEQQHLLD
ncbi:MAG: NAD-dependent epimerase/dehydratase family protein [Phycisphaeraceae bacterium]|nr:NAD-dependent epimerase/dehydratase family protein [Phycisphaeraceae bacterium]